MTLVLYNTLTRSKEPLQPLVATNVRMYVCGPTVYDYAHIGNARPIIVFDVLYRLLRHVYGASHVTYVRNLTDVDDKINARAAQEEVSIQNVTARTIKQFHLDIGALGVLAPNVEPRATDHIEEMKTLCETLVAKRHAYLAANHVLFDVSSMPDYGKLANRSTDEMLAGARVDVASYKKDPGDFVLWKPSSRHEPGWPSPCGIAQPGRPGWHIECSAMAQKHLGETFDIHGGGLDLIFPHHENEIAQSRCAHDTDRMASIWMHNGYLQVEGRKMSKSEGNFITIHELLQDWPGQVLRFNMLRTHYRQPINWTVAGLTESERTLHKLGPQMDQSGAVSNAPAGAKDGRVGLDDDFLTALHDDLNTPLAISLLHGLDGQKLAKSMNLLGLSGKLSDPRQGDVDRAKIEALIAARNDARAAKDWALSDEIRDQLAAMNIILKDTKDKVTGKVVTTWDVKR